MRRIQVSHWSFFDGRLQPNPRRSDQDVPREIRPYHQRLKQAQVGYRYGGTRQYLKRGVYNTIEDLVDGFDRCC